MSKRVKDNKLFFSFLLTLVASICEILTIGSARLYGQSMDSIYTKVDKMRKESRDGKWKLLLLEKEREVVIIGTESGV